MASWRDFEAAMPEAAEAGRKLLYQHGPGLAYLATVRKDGGPRIHPICPLIVDGDLYAFIVGSPKRDDLLRDCRYALHSFPAEDRDDEFYVTGRAAPVSDPDLVARADAAVRAQGTTHGEDDRLFRLGIERTLHAAYKPRSSGNNWPPAYLHWHAP